MSRAASRYVCGACGAVSPKWLGQCPQCLAWNTLIESATPASGPRGRAASAPAAEVSALAQVAVAEMQRLPSGLEEFDRVLGGGLVEAGVVLVGGDPGIGKST